MTPTPFYKSKTVWFNILTIIIAVATAFGFTVNQELSETVSPVRLLLATRQ